MLGLSLMGIYTALFSEHGSCAGKHMDRVASTTHLMRYISRFMHSTYIWQCKYQKTTERLNGMKTIYPPPKFQYVILGTMHSHSVVQEILLKNYSRGQHFGYRFSQLKGKNAMTVDGKHLIVYFCLCLNMLEVK